MTEQGIITPESVHADGAPTPSIRDQVQAVIEELRMYIQYDGGDIELVDVNDQGQVFVRLKGSCVGCGQSDVTLKAGVEERIKQLVPSVTEVVSV